MLEFIAENFSDCIYLAVFLVAIFPAIESKVSIPFGLSKPIWGAATLSPFMACLISFVGTMLPSIFVILLTRKLKGKTSGFIYDKFIVRIKAKIKTHYDKFNEKTTILKKCLYLGCFVALPLPLTGVYTGSIIAGLSNLKVWQSYVSIFIGELLTCIGMTIICSLFENSGYYMFLMSIIMGSAMFILSGIISIISKLKNKSCK